MFALTKEDNTGKKKKTIFILNLRKHNNYRTE